MSDNQQSQFVSQDSVSQNLQHSSCEALAEGNKGRRAPAYPPATEPSKRTASMNYNENQSDDNVVTFTER